jgi:hypothetical protein
MPMNRLKILAAVAVALFVFTARMAHADIANGTYYTEFTDATPIWDISGSYSGDVGTGLGMDFSLTEAPSGNLTGAGTFHDDEPGVVLNGKVNVSGMMKNSAADPRVSMDIMISGKGTVVVSKAGHKNSVSVTASAKVNLEIDAADGEMVSTGGSESVTEKDLTTGKSASRSVSLPKGLLMPLPADSTGAWRLTLDLTPDGTEYTGTATVETSTGATAEFTATGSYDSEMDTSQITLKGAGDNLSLVISTSGSVANIQSVKGKLFGQTLDYEAP